MCDLEKICLAAVTVEFGQLVSLHDQNLRVSGCI